MLIINQTYRIRNLAFSKYIRGNGLTPNGLGQYALDAENTNFVFTAEKTVLTGGSGTQELWKFKTAAGLYWTVSEDGTGALTLAAALSTAGNAFYRQMFNLIQVSTGVAMLEPKSVPGARIQLAGPLDLEGRYIQAFTFQVNHPQEQFAFEMAGVSTMVDKPNIKLPVYSDDKKLYIENVESGAGIQLYKNGQAFGPQQQNTGTETATIEVNVTGLQKGDSLTVEAWKAGEQANRSDIGIVQEFAAIVRVREPNGTVTYNVEVGDATEGNTTANVKPARFSPPVILSSGHANLAAAEAARDNGRYTKTQL